MKAELLRELRLAKIAELCDDEVRKAEKDGRSINDFLVRLFSAQWSHQQEQTLERRIRRARMPEQWTLESFPFKKQPGVSKRQIMALAELEFIPKAENIVFIGETGRGKTGLASGMSHGSRLGLWPAASRGGIRARFTRNRSRRHSRLRGNDDLSG